MLKNLFSLLNIVFVSSLLSLTVSAQTDVNKLLASAAPFETIRYIYAGGIFGVHVENMQLMEKREEGGDLIFSATVWFPDGIVRSRAIVDKKTLRLKRGINEEFGKIIEYEIEGSTVAGTERRGK